jgi:ABC-type antimicrobial peptide transport system permease subunit
VRRRHEFATRATLGAGFSHLLLQLLIESSLFAVCGSELGIAIAYESLRLLLQVRPLQLPHPFSFAGVPIEEVTVLTFETDSGIWIGSEWPIIRPEPWI